MAWQVREMLRLRPYHPDDAAAVLSWCRDERSFYQWTAGVLGDYPLTEEQFHAVASRMAFTALDDGEMVGFFTMRKLEEAGDEVRFGFVIVNSEKRGEGYGRRILQLGVQYAKEHWGAKKASLGIFENNQPAYRCYRAVGFQDVTPDPPEVYRIHGEDWNCLDLEMRLDATSGKWGERL